MFEPTIKDIAKICGVGVSTVSRAINDHPDINPETKEKIMSTIREYGYVPNDSARNLKRVDAKAIAVLVKGIANPFFINMIKVIEQECKKKHYAMELSHIEADEDEVDVAQKVVKEKRLRGIIFLGGLFSHSEEKLKKLSVPFVFSTVGSIPENISKNIYSSISVDDRKESARMVDYLISLGHTQIAILVAEAMEESIGKLRLEGYCDALRAHGIEIHRSLICQTRNELSHFSMENGYLSTKKLLERGEMFTALYAVSDALAIGALRALHDAGLRVPEDISLAGFDGIGMANYTVPSLTTMHQPVEEMAKDTTRLLFDIIAKKTKHQHITYEAELMIKESTAKRP
ncbi:MAG: LacI family transcriptional regulator [Lachnospiraceae bacterium]|nr:LacI family transcriptional regulator [Lachnospiraceae bacterium]MDE7274100.1 LacI family transcriptional regulator [Lachnospiraceae bacterium]